MSNYTCPKCKDNFKYKSIFIRHLKNSVRCKCCDEEIVNIINNPIITTNNNITTDNSIQNKNMFVCNICNNNYKYKTSLYKHKRTSRCNKPISK